MPKPSGSETVVQGTKRSAVKPTKQALIPIFQVTIHGYYNPNVSCALIYTDIYQAATREEAIGMAVDKVNRCYPLMMIKGNGIKCSLLNPIFGDCEVERSEVGVKYDFSECGDTILNDMYSQRDNLNALNTGNGFLAEVMYVNE